MKDNANAINITDIGICVIHVMDINNLRGYIARGSASTKKKLI